MYAAMQRIGPQVHCVVASGGNAGQAAARTAKDLGVKCTVHVHLHTEQGIVNRIEAWGATVKRAQGAWIQANKAALAMARDDPNGVYIHPFEGDDLVLGHTCIVDEMYDDIPEVSEESGEPTDHPDVITVAVGGGGLLRGVMLGGYERALEQGTPSPHVVAVSTIGGDFFSQSLWTEDEFVEVEDPFSLAKSLVCKSGSPIAVRDGRYYAKNGQLSLDIGETKGKAGPYLTALSVDDARAGSAAWQATDELGTMIELSTGAALAPAQNKCVLDWLVREKNLSQKLNVVVIVCGGTRVDLEEVEKHRLYGQGSGKIIADGHVIAE